MSRVYDVDWYRENIADPETGERRRFTGGELGSVDFVLDALWYGVAFENARRKMEHELLGVFGLIEALAGREPRPHRLDLLDTTAWLQAFDILWSPTNIPADIDPANAVNFRLDVLRAMAAQPRSYRRALVHAMDGYDLWEIADLMGWTKDYSLSVLPQPMPNEESAERVVRKASSSVRAHCALGIRSEPKPPAPVPDTKTLQAGDYTTDVITRIEHEIGETRAWRRREERRRRRAA